MDKWTDDGHGVSAQTSALAETYSITLSQNNITVGDWIEFSIAGQHTGILLQTRPMDGSSSDCYSSNLDLSMCESMCELLYKSFSGRKWKATEVGEFALYLTIVQNKSTFWVKEKIGTVVVKEVVAESTVRAKNWSGSEIWSFLEIFRIIVGQQIEFFKIAK